MRRLALVPLLLLAACASRPGKVAKPAASADTYALPAQPVVGRVVEVDVRHRTAVVRLNGDGANIPRAEHWQFWSRRDDLTPTARLEGSAQRFGNSLGVLIPEGLPAVGEEVVLAPPGENP